MEQLLLNENRLPVQQTVEHASLAPAAAECRAADLPANEASSEDVIFCQQQHHQQQLQARAQDLSDAAAAAAGDLGERAHVHQQADAIPQHQLGFFVSASVEKTLCLWSTAGGLVGTFGRNDWNLEKLDSWHDIIKPNLTVRHAPVVLCATTG